MPHTTRHQQRQRALPLRSGDTRTPETKAKFNDLRARLMREIEEKESVAEVRYWERRTHLFTR